MTSFSQGDTLTISLDENDQVYFVGCGNLTVTPTSGDTIKTYLSGNQYLGPYKKYVTLVIVCTSDGTYTKTSIAGSEPVARYSFDSAGVVSGFISPDGSAALKIPTFPQSAVAFGEWFATSGTDASKWHEGGQDGAAGAIATLINTFSAGDWPHKWQAHNFTISSAGVISAPDDATSASYLMCWTDAGYLLVYQAPAGATVVMNTTPTYAQNMLTGNAYKNGKLLPSFVYAADGVTPVGVAGGNGTVSFEKPQTAVLFGDSSWNCGTPGTNLAASPIRLEHNGAGRAGYIFTAAGVSRLNAEILIGNTNSDYWDGRHLTIATQGSVTSTAITNAVNNGVGLIRITSATHGLLTDQLVTISSVTGTTEANANYFVTKIDNDTVDLQNSTFVNAYISGGTLAKRYASIFAINPLASKYPSTFDSYSGIRICWNLSQQYRKSVFHSMNIALGSPFELLEYAAISGQATANMEARLTRDVLSKNPAWVFFGMGGNDYLAKGLTVPVAAANTQALLQKILSNGIKLVVLGWMPDGSAHNDYNGHAAAPADPLYPTTGLGNMRAIQFNQLMNRWCLDHNVIFVDPFITSSNPASATGNAYTAFVDSSGLHYTGQASQALGAYMASKISPYVTARSNLVLSTADRRKNVAGTVISVDSDQYYRNPLLNDGAAVAGVWPNVVVSTYSGTPTVVSSTEARTVADDGDTFGNNQVVTITATAANDLVEVEFLLTAADFALGDIVEIELHARLVGATAANVDTLAYDFGTASLSISNGLFLADGDTTAPILTDVNEKIKFRSAVFDLSSVAVVVYVQCHAAGTPVVLHTGRVSARKLPAGSSLLF
jgi:hypothetical protein